MSLISLQNNLVASKAVGSVMRLRRELLRKVKAPMLRGSRLTYEEADLLCDLYGASKLDWKEPESDSDGNVPISALNSSLQSPELLSRRIAKMEKLGFVKRVPDPLDGRKFSLSITDSGIEEIEPVYERFVSTCERILRNVSIKDTKDLHALNEKIMKELL